MRPVAVALVALALSIGAPSGAAARTVEGVSFAPSVRVGEEHLRLHRAALLRWKGLLKVSVAGLYLAPDVAPDRVLDDVPKRLEIEYLRGFEAQDFVRSTVTLVQRNVTPERFAALRPALAQLSSLYRDVAPGDRYALSYVPGLGTELSWNGRRLGVVEGPELAQAVFSIWLGPDPLDRELRADLLGIR